MIFSCDKEKPATTTCDDIPQYIVRPKGQIFERPESTTWRYHPIEPATTSTTPLPPFDIRFQETTTDRGGIISSTPSFLIGGNEIFSCPEQCPRGPPGLPGAPGIRGLPGAPVSYNIVYGNLNFQRYI